MNHWGLSHDVYGMANVYVLTSNLVIRGAQIANNNSLAEAPHHILNLQRKVGLENIFRSKCDTK